MSEDLTALRMGGRKSCLVVYESGVGRGGSRRYVLSWLEVMASWEDIELKILVGSEGWFSQQLSARGLHYDVLPEIPILQHYRRGNRRFDAALLLAIVSSIPMLARRWNQASRMKGDAVLLSGPRDYLMLLPLVHRAGVRSAIISQSTDWGRVPFAVAACNKCRLAFGISHSVRDSLVRAGVRSEKARTLRACFVDDQGPEQESPSMIRQAKGLAECDYALGLAGRMQGNKGHRVVISAMTYIAQKHPSTKLFIVGDADPSDRGSVEYLAELRRMVAAKGLEDNVVFLGWREDVRRLLRAFDVFLLPSSQDEGVPRVLLEALEAGRPIIASEIEQLREIVEHSNAALMCSPKDDRSWADAICRLLDNDELRVSVGQHSRALWMTDYSPSRCSERLREALDLILYPQHASSDAGA